MTAYTNDAMLPDLRPTIAEIFEGLAEWHVSRDQDCMLPALTCPAGIALQGARTLRWSAEREAWTTEELESQISHLVNIIEEIEEILDRPSGKIKEIRGVVAKTWA